MSYALSNGLSISVYFGKAEFPLSTANRITELHIIESVQLYVPQLNLSLVDTSKFLEKLGLQDGIPITISITNKGTTLQTLSFRLFSFSAKKENYAMKYKITAYLDLPVYWNGLATKTFRGTSSDALSALASECGLSYIGAITSDSQLWTPGCSKNCEYAKYIAERGYASETSCMVLGVTMLKGMIYANIMDLADPIITLRALNTNSDDECLVSSYKVSAASGMNVSNGGYYMTRVKQSVVADAHTDKIESVTVKQNVSSPSINSVVRGMFNKQIITYAPIDCGNVSKHFEDAVYQNKRLKGLYTVNAEFICVGITPLTLCVPFNFYAVDSEGKPDEKDSGIYVTTARILYIDDSSRYYEKILASRIGTNAKYYAN
jgi:hypothetical protein